ncbi:ATP-dependent DNA helicase Q-like SIM [Gossypium australe]|uniref:ATP-dependent DNA helicase Q-like SIM n=1 Tax=Gossypium australe TaxID=47621 RepID=A0A5B6VU77_9ROSI|nr:ATP-dependent DNA helicase Q-like SIM [Gossypium australe]
MGGNDVSSDQVIKKLIEMGFEHSNAIEAVKAVGPSVDDAVEYVLNGCGRNPLSGTTSFQCSSRDVKSLGKRVMTSSQSKGEIRQSRIWEHFRPTSKPKRSRGNDVSDGVMSGSNVLPSPVEEHKEPILLIDNQFENVAEPSQVCCSEELNIGTNWESRVNGLLRKHFGYSSLKSFQKEALAALLAHQDCLVLAATGSGKSLCFQIPALLTGKVVVVVSPLISLMHDQCLKLSKHGVSACFLGSGQPDSSVEQKAMRGMYSIIYVCPETILRLIKPLQKLAESRGITLFAIDEAHCISKWGHDFRPDYRRLSVLRENFSARNLKFLKYDIPIMALTATATVQVRQDILDSLCMSKETKTVVTSFFRPNLRFSVKHSRKSLSSYSTDFCQLIDVYARKKKVDGMKQPLVSHESHCQSDSDKFSGSGFNDIQNSDIEESDDESSEKENGSFPSRGRQMSVEYLENEVDVFQSAEDWDVAYGEFSGQVHCKEWNSHGSIETIDPPNKPEERLRLLQEPLEQGPTIIYVPTRKETLSIAKYLCKFGVKAAAYNAAWLPAWNRPDVHSTRTPSWHIVLVICLVFSLLPKSHLRQVHKEFHDDSLQTPSYRLMLNLLWFALQSSSLHLTGELFMQVVVATMAFGMGIDKLNVRRIIHYGWPQVYLLAYILIRIAEFGSILSRSWSSRKGWKISRLQFLQVYVENMLLFCSLSSSMFYHNFLFTCRYGMNTSCCRAKILVEYFGEDFGDKKCLLCDICVDGPPKMLDLKEEANILMQMIAARYAESSFMDCSYDDSLCSDTERQKFLVKPNLRAFVNKIREQSQKFITTDLLWWKGLARIMEAKGYIREGDDKIHVQIKFPEPTKRGLEFLQSESDKGFHVYPEADMLYSMRKPRAYSSFSDWGKGWANPEIRRERLDKIRSSNRKPRKPRIKKSRKHFSDTSTSRGRISAKISQKK